jgi:hypothetical protein
MVLSYVESETNEISCEAKRPQAPNEAKRSEKGVRRFEREANKPKARLNETK